MILREGAVSLLQSLDAHPELVYYWSGIQVAEFNFTRLSFLCPV